MKKRDLITMFLCVPGAGLFALGMCMCLLPEWGAAVQGVWTGAAGIAVLLGRGCCIVLCQASRPCGISVGVA